MICPRPECPLERLAKALADYEREHQGHWAGVMTQTATCSLCARNRTWRQDSKGETREVERGDVA